MMFLPSLVSHTLVTTRPCCVGRELPHASQNQALTLSTPEQKKKIFFKNRIITTWLYLWLTIKYLNKILANHLGIIRQLFDEAFFILVCNLKVQTVHECNDRQKNKFHSTIWWSKFITVSMRTTSVCVTVRTWQTHRVNLIELENRVKVNVEVILFFIVFTNYMSTTVFESISANFSKNVAQTRRSSSIELVPIISRQECMLSWGTPRSIVLMPNPWAEIGPMVDPQVESFRTITSWK